MPTCEQQFTELREARVLEKEVGKVDFFRDGDVSMICRWPWVVSVRVRISSSTMMHRCSGVLLARNIGTPGIFSAFVGNLCFLMKTCVFDDFFVILVFC